jgi:hypothetical protein
LRRIENLATARTCDGEYRPRLRKVVGSWESPTDRSTSKPTELAAGVPPLGEIHLANPGNNQSQFQQAIKVDFAIRHSPFSLM